jgi:hypothetical protein
MKIVLISMRTLFVAMVVASFAGAAVAQLNINEMAAGSAIPFFTNGQGATTQAVITNTSSDSRVLHFDLINGDENEFCESQSWVCELTGRETVQITFTNDLVGGSTVTFECDAIEGLPVPNAGNDGNINSDAEFGVLWVTVQNELGDTVAENVLFADWTILDLVAGTAFSAPAAGFQGASNDGDQNYAFNGTEYSQFPDSLATNYLPPATNPGALLSFTLDLHSGFPAPVRAKLFWYNDDEEFEDDFLDFQCFELVSYFDIAIGLNALTTAGHMELDPKVTTYGPPHADGARRVPFLCYNIQVTQNGGAIARACAQSTAKFVPADGDTDPNFESD